MKDTVSLAFDAVIFDLDGVVTKTAAVHTKAWKKTFDDFLQTRATDSNSTFNEFTTGDYLKFVDGKPRYEGVASFLKSRDIDLPRGTPDNEPSQDTVCGLGNIKNKIFLEILKQEGAEIYPSTKELLLELNDYDIKTGVASSSKNCKAVLEATGLLSLFQVRVDGIVSAQMNLKGKPEPDIFTKACELLNVLPENSIVVEDAVSGVQAGAKGNFGLTLGIARRNNAGELETNGADYVISDFNEIDGSEGLNRLFLKFTKK